jgi:2-polyprenyl-3-methyl-5-hydroxy-6-metoxy-1,4-benzoquinol methylase
MTDILNGQALGTAMCLGYRAGIFEAMDSLNEPVTSARIAQAAGLSERYVREWLAVMACGGVVELSASPSGEDLFFLPREHGDLLTRRAESNNVGMYTQELPLLTQCALDDVQRAMHTGKGVPYDRYPPFQAWMAEVAEAKHRRVLVDVFLPSVAGGEVVKRLGRGIRVLDVGCSRGVAVLLMAAAFPKSEFVGIDICWQDLEVARAEAAKLGLVNARFEVCDAAELAEGKDWAGMFDYVTAFDSIHDQTRPKTALSGIRALLREGGMFSMVDIKAESELPGNLHHPLGAFLYTVSLMHCLPVALVDGGAGLGIMWGRKKAVALLEEAGFGKVEVCDIPTDAFNAHYLCWCGED